MAKLVQNFQKGLILIFTKIKNIYLIKNNFSSLVSQMSLLNQT